MLTVIDIMHRDLSEEDMRELRTLNKHERQVMAGEVATELRRNR